MVVFCMNHVDCIDASVILGSVFREDENCDNFVNTIGYKLKNNGLLTIHLVGEIFTSVFLKIVQYIEYPFEKKQFLQDVVDFFDKTIINLFERQRLSIAKVKDSDYQHIMAIKSLDYAITDDDALHLSVAINNNCQRFVTIDKVLLKEDFRSKIKAEFRLIITKPN